MLKWDHWHIEPSSICALKCPRCPRNEVPETLLNKQLSLGFFQQRIGEQVIKNIKKITFCGNDGDPIYCKDLINICEWIKRTNTDLGITIITNGSHKTKEWWIELGKVLNEHDQIHWSIDGWDQKSNSEYRVNSDWDSIMQGITSFSEHNQSTYKIWASIAFRFNQDSLVTMEHLARDMGFDRFQLTKSTKFGSKYPSAYGVDDTLEPTKTDLVSSSHRFERNIIALNAKPDPDREIKKIFISRAEDLKKSDHSGICLIGNKGVFLNSQGEFYPCCWTANRYDHNRDWHGRFNLNHRTFEDIISDPFWRNDFLKFDSLECRTKCTTDRLADVTHTTEW